MKAAVFLGKGQMDVQEKPIPVPAADEVLVRVKACGICGTDQHIFHGMPGSAAVEPPRVLGHELAGEAAAVGNHVRHIRPGDRVTVDPNIYCGKCSYCLGGRPHLCDALQAVGVTRDGGMGEYCVVPAANCHLLPDALTYEEGAMVEPLGCVLHGIQQLKVWPGASVLIIGGGFIGQMMLQMAKLYGACPIIVSEPDETKHPLALQMGADMTLNPLKDGALQHALAQLGGGADIVIECVGRGDTMQQAVKSAKKGGQVLLFGVAAPDAQIQVSPFEIFSKELTIRGSFINPHTHPQAISLLEQGRVKVKPLLSHTFSVDELPQAMADYPRLRVMKGIVRF